jgi:hypothetical protein
MKKGYNEIKNFFHNELKLSKEEIKEIASKAIRDETHSQVQRYFQNNPINKDMVQEVTAKEVVRLINGNTINSNSKVLMEHIAKGVCRQLNVTAKD